ncbi:hypothetical protein GWI33_008178 [Rhynchophorus ferrugineus]|uniref:Uncharacterized protein n=1 Tax=Rhynchophorus ferrugineus TaxID=354439 RepID=A0A834MCE4_RHYFE|nr:hypothetical protein GWI33_008178 [Rhynchophorus ferrugineus]
MTSVLASPPASSFSSPHFALEVLPRTQAASALRVPAAREGVISEIAALHPSCLQRMHPEHLVWRVSDKRVFVTSLLLNFYAHVSSLCFNVAIVWVRLLPLGVERRPLISTKGRFFFGETLYLRRGMWIRTRNGCVLQRWGK